MAKIGLQLYTVRRDFDADYAGTLRKVALMGYQGVEFSAGLMRLPSSEISEVIRETGLEIAGNVFLLNELSEDFENVLTYCKEIASPAIIFPWIPKEHRTVDGYAALARMFNKWGKRLKENGLKFLYHVHGYEFEKIGGNTGMEIILEELNPEYFNLEVDVYWVEKGGADAVEFMKSIGSRSPYIHFKDAGDKVNFEDVEVGAGYIDMAAIARIGLENKAEWFIVEQEKFTIPPLESAEISCKNLFRIAREAGAL